MTIRTFSLSAALLLAGFTVGHAQMVIQNDRPQSPLEVIATNGVGDEKHLPSINGVVPVVMVKPNQTVPVTLQFPADKAGAPVAATPLDGGRINRDNLVVLPTGKVVFTFQPGAAPGRYRVLVRMSVEEYLLEFYVVDPADPPSRPRSVR